MHLDNLAIFSNEQAVTDTAFGIDKLDATSAIDLNELRGVGSGVPLSVVFNASESAAAAGAATVTFQVVQSDSPTLSNFEVMAQSGAIPKTDIVAGKFMLQVPVPPNHSLTEPRGKRYIGVRYLVASGPLTAGKFSASLIAGSIPSSYRLYPGNFTVA